MTTAHHRTTRPAAGRKAAALALSVGALSAVAGLTGATPAAAATVTVTAADTSWSATNATGGFLRDSGAYSLQTTDGGAPGFGAGAVVLDTSMPDNPLITGDPKVTYSTLAPAATTLAALDASDISYWTNREAGNDSQVAAINLGVDINGPATGGFTTLVFEPVYNPKQGAVTTGTWQHWDANSTGIWWSSNVIPGAPDRSTFLPLSDIITQNPDAVVLTYAVNQGGGNPGLRTAVDGFAVGGTTYDFEVAAAVPPTAADCKDGGWRTLVAAGEFRNQGDCVSYFVSGGRSHLKG